LVNDDEAFDMTRMLTIKEGFFVGMSSGAAMHIALRKSSEIKEGVIVVIFPDRGDRYLSTSLFTSVCAKCPP
jgi:cysteine synthase B